MTDLAGQRRLYAESLQALVGFNSTELLDAFATVPRERFLGPGPWHIPVRGPQGQLDYRTTDDADPACLYKNVLVAIDRSRGLNNGEPSSWAAWIDALRIRIGERIVHVGSGTGYYSAILAECVGPTGHVVSIEVDPVLAQQARTNLAYLRHVEVVTGNGGGLRLPPADVLLINAGVTHLPAGWLDALNHGGRLLLPVTGAKDQDAIGFGGMFVITRLDTGYAAECISPVGIFPCVGVRDPAYSGQLLRKTDSDWQAVRSVRREVHERDATCWLHTREGCFSTLGTKAA
ncbi:MAG: methyltransferase domain-containing protein [Vicinamibacterales bacterium]